MKKIVENVIKKISRTTIIHGGWGIGKTYFVKNHLIKALEAESNVLYVDARVMDVYPNISDFIFWIGSELKKEEKKDKKIKIPKKLIPHNFSLSIKAWFVGASFSWKQDEETMGTISGLSKDKELIFIFDELDRLTPPSLINVLNLTNSLQVLFPEVKIITVGNIEQINNTLSKDSNIMNSGENFIDKYFEKSIDLSEISSNAIEDVFLKYGDKVPNNKFLFDYWKFSKCTHSVRKVERILNDSLSIPDYFSDEAKTLMIAGELNNNIESEFYRNGVRFYPLDDPNAYNIERTRDYIDFDYGEDKLTIDGKKMRYSRRHHGDEEMTPAHDLVKFGLDYDAYFRKWNHDVPK